jgi:hypothetical protein
MARGSARPDECESAGLSPAKTPITVKSCLRLRWTDDPVSDYGERERFAIGSPTAFQIGKDLKATSPKTGLLDSSTISMCRVHPSQLCRQQTITSQPLERWPWSRKFPARGFDDNPRKFPEPNQHLEPIPRDERRATRRQLSSPTDGQPFGNALCVRLPRNTYCFP